MKRISSLFVFIYVFTFFSFAQKEIWGYHSLAGKDGGGMIFNMDPETKEYLVMHRFGHLEKHTTPPINKEFFTNGDGKLYGNTANAIFSFDPISTDLNYLAVLNGLQIMAMDSGFIYLSNISGIANPTTEIFAYNILTDTFGIILEIPKVQGYTASGKWLKQENNTYLVFMRNGGEAGDGTIVEIDMANRISRKMIDFLEIKDPVGGLVAHSNTNIYGVLQRGDTNSRGSIIKIDPRGDSYIIEAAFTKEIGYVVYGEMFEADDGNFYGTTKSGGDFKDGTIYKFNPVQKVIEAVYHIDDDSDEIKSYKLSGYFAQLSQDKLIGILERKGTNKAGRIFSFDLITHEFSVLADFQETEMAKPIGQLTFLNNQFYGIVQSDTIHDAGGVFSYHAVDQQLNYEKNIYSYEIAENGQNPMWMCQGENGLLYGMTRYGGKENGGIVFELDPSTCEFEKKLDLVDFDYPIEPLADAYVVEPGVILGISETRIPVIVDSITHYRTEVCIFEYNYLNNLLSTRLIVPDSLVFNYLDVFGFRMNSNGNVYFSRQNYLIEYIYHSNSLKATTIPESLGLRDIIELSPNEYVVSQWGGTSEDKEHGSIIALWNAQTNDIRTLVYQWDLLDTVSYSSLTNQLFCSSDSILFGYFRYKPEPFQSYYESFTYDIGNDSLIIGNSPFDIAMNNHKRNSIIESENGLLIENSLYNEMYDVGEINIFDTDSNEISTIKLEKSSFWYKTVGVSWQTNANFEYLTAVDLLLIENKNPASYWTGKQDTTWYQEKNWYGSKQPSGLSNIVIPPYMPNYPTIDTMVNSGNILIHQQANIKLNPNASLSCQSIFNGGELKFYANNATRASLISSDSIINKGNISYSFVASDSGRVVLGNPIKSVKLEDLDSIPVWEFDGYDWISIQNPSAVLTPLQGYSFALDYEQELKFSGDLNYGNISYNFLSNSNMLEVMANPYPSSFDWRRLDISHMDNQALYKFNAADSSFTSYIDGLGSASPLVQPLEAFIINSSGSMQFELDNSQRIHAVDFKDDSTYTKNKLTIKAEGKDGGDLTHISLNHLATANFDGNYDALKFLIANKARPQIFTFAGDEILSINQLPDTAMMDLAVQAGQDANFTISIEKNLGFEFVVLEDLIWKKKTDLLKQDYSFDYLVSDSTYPFKLYFKPWAIQPVNEADIEIYYYPESIVVRSRKQIDFAYISFFDLAGRVVLELQAKEFHHFEKPISLPVGHYIVQVRTGDLVVNRKVLVRR